MQVEILEISPVLRGPWLKFTTVKGLDFIQALEKANLNT